MIELLGVNKIYNNRVVALRQVTLSIGKGEFVFLVGPSGAGKSTLIKLLTCEEKITSGQLMVLNKSLGKIKSADIPYLRRQMGIVFQDFRLLDDKTAYENIAFAMEVIEARPKDIRRRVPQVLELVGLKDKGRAYPRQLSGGEQQRVSLARALVNNPSILICDEPTGNLDPDTSWEIMSILAKINQYGTTVIMATHAKDIVDYMRKRVIAVEQGIVVRDDERGVYGNAD